LSRGPHRLNASETAMPRRSGGPRAASVPPGIGVVRALDWNHRAVKCVAFDPGLGKLAGGSLDGTVSLWDTTEGKLLRTFEWRRSPFEWQRSEVASVAFDPAGRLLASGSANGNVHLWDTESGELLHACPGQGGSVEHGVSPDGVFIGERRWRWDGKSLGRCQPQTAPHISRATRRGGWCCLRFRRTYPRQRKHRRNGHFVGHDKRRITPSVRKTSQSDLQCRV